mgnify:CR=1 FL=1
MKIKLGVFFGGKSVEHEIAIITANQAMTSLNKDKYEIVPIYISKSGKMYTGEKLIDLKEYRDLDKLIRSCEEVVCVNDGNKAKVLRVNNKVFGKNIVNTIEVAFPIMHGTNGEDGSIQGFLEILGVPYIGPDVLASSIGMDKIMMRRILKEQGIPSLDYVAFYSLDYIKDENKYIKEIEEKLTYPVIVKAGNLGSSVGIKKAKDREDLVEAIEFAMEFSDRIMVENAIVKLKEINCSVMGDMIDAVPSTCEEPIGSDEILSYTDKYVGNNKTKGGSKSQGMATLQRKVPADISEEMTKKIQDIAVKTFRILGCNGVSRIDFMIDLENNNVYVNEINTIPGALSFYLWEATGKSFEKELDELVEIAFKRNRERQNRTYSYDQNILALGNGVKGAKGAKQ